jgi:predicted TIM-barrel fold metal-dependent hydrolase
VVTVSGVFAAQPLRRAVDALGRDKVMFAADALEAGHLVDNVAIEEGLRADIAYNNAAKLFRF